MCMRDYVKNRIVTCEKCVFWCEKRYKRISALGSPKTYCQCLDKGRISRALLIDLSKAFDSLLQNLLIAKLAVYGFEYDSLVFIQS